MKNIAPDIFRQRLLMEGFYAIEVSRDTVERFLNDIADCLGLRTYGEAVVFSPSAGTGKEKNQGFDAFIPLIDSGISIYIWSEARFFSIVLYTCREFDEQKAVDFTREFFKTEGEIEYLSF